ncbi:MAG: helix-turn-helix transcriptional regulator [Candidatus Eremiobacteraeota bacterium]|nr:helix-turn-helix transcriptional regulator [Candidatus Eremiobacteraeota bacterium]MBC5821950.1 helix-turn-helix transcriptional regulator [Candidatus Eremiobacteraeota bacterium]
MDERDLERQATVLRQELRQLRNEQGVTQTELAERLGQPQSYVSKYESGERRLDLPEIRVICVALNVPLRTLIERFESAL